ncbi:MAG: hypothetical protein Q4F05_03365 [bacterium]|nr:hypothetical protein [bacterium]
MRDLFWGIILIILSTSIIIASLQYLLADFKSVKKKETNPELVEDDIEAINDKDTLDQSEKEKHKEEGKDTYPFKGIIIGMLAASIVNVVLKLGFEIDISSQIYVLGIFIGLLIGRYIEKKR